MRVLLALSQFGLLVVYQLLLLLQLPLGSFQLHQGAVVTARVLPKLLTEGLKLPVQVLLLQFQLLR